MYMDNKLYNSRYNPAEKIVLNFILTGHKRIKFLSYDTIANNTHISKSQVSRILKKFVEDHLIIQKKPLLKKYYLTIFSNDVFIEYCDQVFIFENRIGNDENINMICNNLEKQFRDYQIKNNE